MSQGQGATTVTGLELDETLQEGFRSLAELPNEELSDETREQVWRAVSGQLPTAERRALIDRPATDAACAEAWRVAHEMWLAFQPVDRVVPWHRRTSWTSPWLAAAAALAVAAPIGLLSFLYNQTGGALPASPRAWGPRRPAHYGPPLIASQPAGRRFPRVARLRGDIACRR